MGENCAVLDYFSSSGNFFPMFQNDLLVSSSRVKNPKRGGDFGGGGFFTLEDGKDRFS